jgi:hypothetical protein
MEVSNRTSIGRVGEFFAAYVLETYGVEVHHVDRSAADLWCQVRGSLCTVQVKSSSSSRRSNAGRKAKYHYHTPPVEVDWYCFVALDKQLLLMSPCSLVPSKTTSFDPLEFNEANQRRTIDGFVGSFSG